MGGGHLGTPVHLYRDATPSGGGVALADSPNWTGSHVWDQEDAGTTTVPTPVTLQHRNNAAGTPAAGYGVGEAFKLDSSLRNNRVAGELDVVWSTATDAAESSALVVKLMTAGAAAAEVMRIGAGSSVPQFDTSFSVGRALIDARSTDVAFFSHQDMTSTSNYALQQQSNGAVRVNCANGQTLDLRHNNVVRLQVSSVGLSFFGASTVAQQSITGSRAGNAALADLLTKLALTGLIVDTTTA